MAQRAQASVEGVALTIVALALATALVLGIARLGPPLAADLTRAISGVVAPGPVPTAPLDGVERALVTAATDDGAEGPTLLDVRAHLRARLGRGAGDAAFDALVRPIAQRAL